MCYYLLKIISNLKLIGKEEKKVSRVNSFTNFIRSPSRPKSMRKSSSNPFSKLLFRRKSSKEKDTDSKDEGSTGGAGDDDAEDENAPSLVEEVKEVVGTAIDNVLHHHHKHTSTEEGNDAAVSPKSRDVSSTDVTGTKEHKPSLLDKFKEEVHVAEHSADHLADKFKVGLGKAKESFKGDYDKAKEGLESILHIDHKSSEKKPVDIILDNKKPIVEEVKAPSLAKRVQEEVVAVVNTIKDDPKKGEAGKEESKEIKGEIKKEDGCVSSLAQGLEKMCAPWSSKKEV
ncbi:uncharacterized protein LOC141591245 [Silene latifolia]|uniref:uncharacterized protein LOC141591245 n=1 Tax=Silene latifolia TaxID=37657 RepID=UPI003D77EBC9